MIASTVLQQVGYLNVGPASMNRTWCWCDYNFQVFSAHAHVSLLSFSSCLGSSLFFVYRLLYVVKKCCGIFLVGFSVSFLGSYPYRQKKYCGLWWWALWPTILSTKSFLCRSASLVLCSDVRSFLGRDISLVVFDESLCWASLDFEKLSLHFGSETAISRCMVTVLATPS